MKMPREDLRDILDNCETLIEVIAKLDDEFEIMVLIYINTW